MKSYKKVLILLLLLLIYIYTCSLVYIPDNYILFQGEKLNLNTLLGINVKQVSTTNPNIGSLETYQAKQTSSSIVNNQTGTISLSLKLFNKISLKNISVNVIPKTTVIPVGNIIGLKLYTKGVLVVRNV